jgi:hypothetical protein
MIAWEIIDKKTGRAYMVSKELVLDSRCVMDGCWKGKRVRRERIRRRKREIQRGKKSQIRIMAGVGL